MTADAQSNGSGQQPAPDAPAEPKPDEHTIPGPPPAFQISVLELDAQLQESLARMNASHSFGREEDANARFVEAPPSPGADTALALDAPEDAAADQPAENAETRARTGAPPREPDPVDAAQSSADATESAARDAARMATVASTAQGPAATVATPAVLGEEA
ncbi:hypothetical protein AIOL_003353 [Candidatus Rhodobacter oscarellae]|uniref:Uncharacterized protein n=2 Tax=Candidatus Rhodobacter oscarellae TaxID=1675527 RepID=A0A0J9E6I2_9RHOB|nr:hypothetical protein AIOL_003353 [Candidatus Rhodobacter lobularis]